jgi:thioredoxin reductase
MASSRRSPASAPHDALIIGGGAAGLSAALILGRARRSVLVIDNGQPRNSVVEYSHGFMTRDGVPPAELLRLARKELENYPDVRQANDSIRSASRDNAYFRLAGTSGATYVGKRLLMATGVFDDVPKIDGIKERWGRSIFVCPYCDGWEVRDQRIAVYGKGRDAVELAQELRGWSADLIVCMERDDLTARDRRWIKASKVMLKCSKVQALSGPLHSPITIIFEDGEELTCQSMFISAPLHQHSPLFAELGCKIGADGLVVVDANSLTTVAGCYAAGDAVTKRHQIIVSAASGAAAAINLNSNLLDAEARALSSTNKPTHR